jgi:putative photosynthetic complex assembly protein 2
MASYVAPPLYAAFVWWFSTGAVLLLVGLSKRYDALKFVVAVGLFAIALLGLAESAGSQSVTATYVAFTSTILLWGAQEIAFLAGWLTGPRPRACPADARGARRFWLALQAIIYHEVTLLACGAVVASLTIGSDNQVGFWTFAALWVLRQSAKINLFLGVPVTNDELMPDAVSHLKTYFARKPVSVFFPLSVTLATATLVIMIQRIVEVAATPFDIAGLTLVSTLFGLGVVEHWFMLLPLPALTLWGWGMQPMAAPDPVSNVVDLNQARPSAVTRSTEAPVKPQLVTSTNLQSDEKRSVKSERASARQRLEDQFRKTFLEQHPRGDLAAARMTISAEPAATVSGRPA